MTSDRDQLAELIHDAVYSGAQRVNWEDIADAILAAGWRPPKPPCEHRMIVHGGACGSCGQMPPPPTEEDLALLQTALARIERVLRSSSRQAGAFLHPEPLPPAAS